MQFSSAEAGDQEEERLRQERQPSGGRHALERRRRPSEVRASRETSRHTDDTASERSMRARSAASVAGRACLGTAEKAPPVDDAK